MRMRKKIETLLPVVHSEQFEMMPSFANCKILFLLKKRIS